MTNVEAKIKAMRSQGYLPAPEVAETVHADLTTVHRWIKAKNVVSCRSGGRWWIERASLIKHIGEVPARAFGLLPAEAEQKPRKTAGKG